MTSTTRLLFGKRIIAVGVTVSEREAGVGAGAGVFDELPPPHETAVQGRDNNNSTRMRPMN